MTYGKVLLFRCALTDVTTLVKVVRQNNSTTVKIQLNMTQGEITLTVSYDEEALQDEIEIEWTGTTGDRSTGNVQAQHEQVIENVLTRVESTDASVHPVIMSAVVDMISSSISVTND